jgi:hypothetical protein
LAGIFEFLDVLELSGELEVMSIDPPGRLLSEVGKFSNRLKVPAALRKLVSDAALISKFFRVPMSVPDKITEHDAEKIQALKRIATGECLTKVEISASLIKNSSLKEQALKFLGGAPVSLRMENPTGWQKIQLFGKTIDTGPVAFIAEDVTVIGGDQTRKDYLEAPEGAAINWKGMCNGQCRFIPAGDASHEAAPGFWSIASEWARGDST